MSARLRRLTFAAVVVLVVGLIAAYVVTEGSDRRARFAASPSVATTDLDTVSGGPRLVFRHTGIDDHYGLVAMVALDDPSGPRAFTELACDRVDATASQATCLQVERGPLPHFQQLMVDDGWSVTDSVALRGIPSRTRLSPDGALVASTSFVSGHSYLQAGFSTATEIRSTSGRDHGNLERFTLVVDGETVTARDRNMWGVTFLDDRTFYATTATGGHTYLVRGDLTARTLTVVRDNAACPSLSPDGTQVAYKVDVGKGRLPRWTVGVLDLASGTERVLDVGDDGLDDQVEWLDDDTVLYGLPRADEPGVTDVWSLDVAAGAQARLLVPEAWSPAVVLP